MLRRLAAALLAALVLPGCATDPDGVRVFQPSAHPQAASVKGFWQRESLQVWEGLRIYTIDDRFVNFGLAGDPYNAPLKIEPGERAFVVGVAFNRGAGTGGPFNATVTVVAQVEPGADYQLASEVKGNAVLVWLEDLRSRKRTAAGSAEWKTTPEPLGIPVYIAPPRKK